MDDSYVGSILLFIAFVLFSAYFSASETAFTSLNQIRLKNEADLGDKKAKRALALQSQFDSLLSTILIGNNIVNIGASAIATVVLLAWFPKQGATLSTVLTTIILLLCSEITPKLIAKLAPESIAKLSAPFLKAIMFLLKPLVWLINQWQKFIQRILPLQAQAGISEQELLFMVDEARLGGSIEKDEHRLVKAAINFDDRTVASILTPRVDLVAVDIEDSDQVIDETFMAHPYSRLLVYEDQIDHILGVLHERDFNRYLRAKLEADPTANLESILSDVLFIPQTMTLARLLHKMQKQKVHMAVVRDEHGGVMGIVTMEDVLEALVGEIWDEDEVIINDYEVMIPDQHYQFNGSCSIEKAFALLHMPQIEKGLYHTINGFAMHHLAKIPEKGDRFSVGEWNFKVLEDDRQGVEILDAVLQTEPLTHLD